MNEVNKTLYIPLYGKAYVSKRGLFLNDKKAEEIWEAEGFSLKGKSKSKWLAFYMGIRSAVFDGWLSQKIKDDDEAVIIHIGCGLDSRALRVGSQNHSWYDVDFPEVIEERRLYYTETDDYKMLSGDARDCGLLSQIPQKKHAVVVMEGVSMYLTSDELKKLTESLCGHFEQVDFLMDCYTEFAARMSKRKNPINDVGVTLVYGLDNPLLLENNGLKFIKEHEMTPRSFVDKLKGTEKFIFKSVYAGSFSKKLYRLYEYKKS